MARTGATSTALTVLLAVTEVTEGGRDFLAAAWEGDKSVEIPVGEASVPYSVSTVNDEEEPPGVVTVSLREDSAYVKDDSGSSAAVIINDDDADTNIGTGTGTGTNTGTGGGGGGDGTGTGGGGAPVTPGTPGTPGTATVSFALPSAASARGWVAIPCR